MTGFAQDITSGVWLKRIIINNGDSQITLLGSATTTAAIMQFLQNISQDPIFDNRAFKIFQLKNVSRTNNRVDFILSTESDTQNIMLDTQSTEQSTPTAAAVMPIPTPSSTPITPASNQNAPPLTQPPTNSEIIESN